MALVPLAEKGNYFHVYDFRVKAGANEDLEIRRYGHWPGRYVPRVPRNA
jgi:hypothetical protein